MLSAGVSGAATDERVTRSHGTEGTTDGCGAGGPLGAAIALAAGLPSEVDGRDGAAPSGGDAGIAPGAGLLRDGDGDDSGVSLGAGVVAT